MLNPSVAQVVPTSDAGAGCSFSFAREGGRGVFGIFLG